MRTIRLHSPLLLRDGRTVPAGRYPDATDRDGDRPAIRVRSGQFRSRWGEACRFPGGFDEVAVYLVSPAGEIMADFTHERDEVLATP